MRLPRLLATLTVLTALLVAAGDVGAQPPPVLERTGTGTLDPGGPFPDAGFQLAYAFRTQGMAPGSGVANGVTGAVAPCVLGDASCQQSLDRTFATGAHAYGLGLTFGGAWTGNPGLYVASWGDWSTATELFLDGYLPGSTLDAFYILLRAPNGVAMDLRDLYWIGAPPSTDVDGFGTTTGGDVWALYRSVEDLRDNFLFLDLYIDPNAGGTPAAPSVEIYVGTIVPEPATVTLTAIGLAGLLGVALRRRSALG